MGISIFVEAQQIGKTWKLNHILLIRIQRNTTPETAARLCVLCCVCVSSICLTPTLNLADEDLWVDFLAEAAPVSHLLVWWENPSVVCWKCLNQGDQSVSAPIYFNCNYPGV